MCAGQIAGYGLSTYDSKMPEPSPSPNSNKKQKKPHCLLPGNLASSLIAVAFRPRLATPALNIAKPGRLSRLPGYLFPETLDFPRLPGDKFAEILAGSINSTLSSICQENSSCPLEFFAPKPRRRLGQVALIRLLYLPGRDWRQTSAPQEGAPRGYPQAVALKPGGYYPPGSDIPYAGP
jgi:hypothetical protein